MNFAFLDHFVRKLTDIVDEHMYDLGMLQIGPTMVTAGQKLVHHQARIDLLQLEQSRLAAELAAGEEWDRDGFNSAYDWIRVNCHLPGHVAGHYLSVGAHLPELGQSA